jgi:hypothetical protein
MGDVRILKGCRFLKSAGTGCLPNIEISSALTANVLGSAIQIAHLHCITLQPFGTGPPGSESACSRPGCQAAPFW